MCANSPTPSAKKACSNLCSCASCRAKTPTTLFPASAAITLRKAAGLHELPCIEKIADDAETLELALIENLQRKDLTAFEEADGLQRLADHFDYTHDDIARKIGRARSSVTETLSLRVIPRRSIRKACVEQRNRLEIALASSRSPAQRKKDARNGPCASRRAASRAMKRAAPARKKPNPLRVRSLSYSTFRPRTIPSIVALAVPQEPGEREELAAVLREVLRRIESGIDFIIRRVDANVAQALPAAGWQFCMCSFVSSRGRVVRTCEQRDL